MRFKTHKLADVALGLTGGLVVFAAVPGVLVFLVGDPFPADWTEAALLSLHGLFELLAVVAWCAWAVCAWSLLRSVVVRVQTRDTSVTPRLVDQLAVRIAVAILAIAPAGIVSTGGSAGATVRRVRAATAPPAGHVMPARDAHIVGTHVVGTHVVGAGESLWRIATTWYGDGSAWPVIAAANLDHTMRDGARFVDPSHARTGWVVTVPPLDPERPGQVGLPLLDGQLLSTMSRSASIPGQPGIVRPSRGGGRGGGGRGGGGRGAPEPLPELAALGAGSLVAALLARRAREQRLLRSLNRLEGAPTPLPRPGEVALSALLAPFEHSPLLHWVEAGSWLLTLAARERHEPLPAVQWFRVGNDGVDVHFASEPPAPRMPWVVSGQATWRLPASVELERVLAPAGTEPWCPIVVPVGDDGDATWLLPIPAGGSVAVVGPLAGPLVLAMRESASRWSWHEALVVTDDVTAAAAAAVGGNDVPRSHLADPTAGPHVLFVGDPRTLPDHVRARCAVLSTETSIDPETTVLVDRRGTTLHPYGVALRAHLLDSVWAEAIPFVAPSAAAVPEPPGSEDEIDRANGSPSKSRADRVEGPLHPSTPLRHHSGPSVTARVGPSRAPMVLFATERAATGEPTSSGLLRPPGTGSADVRLLTSVPRIDDLDGELPPKRARRATELIAYLALHCPEPVTGDRLRTRVLGGAEADAAAKTLFNTVHAARRALGRLPDGTLLLPPASRTGHYRISTLVTVDARRAGALIESGLAARDAEESLALIERGLSLIEGEPLGAVLTGYGWWRAEGHERQFADLVVDGACALSRGAIATGQVDRARWAITRARRVEAYSEALTRAAMEVAAASGDAARLRTEWLDCRRQVDELDPGGMPSAVTERLYAHLRAQLGVEVRTDEAAPAGA